MKRATRLVAVIAMLSLMAGVACSSKANKATTKKTLKIAFLGALTGDNAQLEIHASQGAALAVEQANARGDLPVTLQYLPEDTQGSKDQATPIANQLKDDASLVAVVGPGFSGESFAVNPIFGQAGIPEVDHSATNPGLNAIAGVSGKTWFRSVGNDNAQGGPAPDIIFKYLKKNKVFIGHDKSAYGEGLATIVKNGVNAKYPGKVAGFEGVDPGKKDYSSLVSKIITSGADIFYWGGYSPESSLIMKQLREKGSKIQFMGADGSKDTTFLAAKAAVEGSYLTCPCVDPNISTDPAAVKFVADYKALQGDHEDVRVPAQRRARAKLCRDLPLQGRERRLLDGRRCGGSDQVRKRTWRRWGRLCPPPLAIFEPRCFLSGREPEGGSVHCLSACGRDSGPIRSMV